jgi:hypothetical protein
MLLWWGRSSPTGAEATKASDYGTRSPGSVETADRGAPFASQPLDMDTRFQEKARLTNALAHNPTKTVDDFHKYRRCF